MNENNYSPSTDELGNDPWGVVLLGHGSQRGSHTIDGLREVVRQLQSRLGDDNAKVVLACLEFIDPSLPQAAIALADEGFSRVIVMPFLLGQGTHATDDLQEEIDKALVERPNLEIHATPPLGCDPALIDIVVDRVVNDSVKSNGTVGTEGVLMVKAGTRHPDEDHMWFMEMGRTLEASLGGGYVVEVAQSHFGEPSMETAVSRLIEERGASTITCVPYIFFPGLILTRNIEGGIDELNKTYPNVPFSVTPTLGVDDRLVNLTARRISETMSNLNKSTQANHEQLAYRAD